MKTLFRIALSVVIVVANLAGMVITQAGASEQGKALVYVAAFAPDEGQAAGELGKAYPAPPGLSHPVVDSAGFMRLADEDIAKYFAPELSSAEANLLPVTQSPITPLLLARRLALQRGELSPVGPSWRRTTK
jgi:hypothetical protein